MNFTELEKQLIEKKTPYVKIEPCNKCGCHLFYYRKGRKHNGCINCRIQKQLTTETEPPAAQILDINGNQIYEGRKCTTCGNKMRISVNAYGAKRGTCLQCAIHQQQEREHGKKIKRLTIQVNEYAHKFIVSSIERSGTIEVAPRNLMEWLEVKDLVNRCKLQNEQERILGTGVKWELCHNFPASGGGTELRGKATVENLYIAQYQRNRKEGNNVPDEWTLKQVVSFDDVREIQNSFQAAKAWKNRREWAQMTPEEKEEHTRKENEIQERHKQLVREITRGVTESLPIIEKETFMSFEYLLDRVSLQWEKITLRMSKQIDAALQNGNKIPYFELREQRLTIDALTDANSRAWIILQTLQQLADAELILREQGITEEQEQQLLTLKRCAVMWAQDIADNPRMLVMGFTHPLLEVLASPKVWGTRYDDATNQQWLCAWDEPELLRDSVTPFDIDLTDDDNANRKCKLLTPEPIREWGLDEAKAWKATDIDFIHEKEANKRNRERLEKIKEANQKQQEERRQHVKEQTSQRLNKLIESLTDGLEQLYQDALDMIPENYINEAFTLVDEQYQTAAEQLKQLLDINARIFETVEDFEDAVNKWQALNDYKMRQMRNPSHVFSDLLNPF
ncbi:hypothetical protein CMS34_22950 [Salmonella enterica]|nr:hypothetical protein [Salmonella enterica]